MCTQVRWQVVSETKRPRCETVGRQPGGLRIESCPGFHSRGARSFPGPGSSVLVCSAVRLKRGSGLEGAYVMTYACCVSTIPVTTARSQLYRLIDQVNEDSEPLVITGQRGNAVLVGEEDWRAIQETLYLESVPGMMDSIRNARREGIEAGSEELDW